MLRSALPSTCLLTDDQEGVVVSLAAHREQAARSKGPLYHILCSQSGGIEHGQQQRMAWHGMA